jgi:hypothetical protein
VSLKHKSAAAANNTPSRATSISRQHCIGWVPRHGKFFLSLIVDLRLACSRVQFFVYIGMLTHDTNRYMLAATGTYRPVCWRLRKKALQIDS